MCVYIDIYIYIKLKKNPSRRAAAGCVRLRPWRHAGPRPRVLPRHGQARAIGDGGRAVPTHTDTHARMQAGPNPAGGDAVGEALTEEDAVLGEDGRCFLGVCDFWGGGVQR